MYKMLEGKGEISELAINDLAPVGLKALVSFGCRKSLGHERKRGKTDNAKEYNIIPLFECYSLPL